MPYTSKEKLAAICREVKYRKRVYKRMVELRNMTPQKAEYEIAIMEEIAEDYWPEAEAEEAAVRLL